MNVRWLPPFAQPLAASLPRRALLRYNPPSGRAIRFTPVRA